VTGVEASHPGLGVRHSECEIAWPGHFGSGQSRLHDTHHGWYHNKAFNVRQSQWGPDPTVLGVRGLPSHAATAVTLDGVQVTTLATGAMLDGDLRFRRLA
jgi:hypothetical protein